MAGVKVHTPVEKLLTFLRKLAEANAKGLLGNNPTRNLTSVNSEGSLDKAGPSPTDLAAIQTLFSRKNDDFVKALEQSLQLRSDGKAGTTAEHIMVLLEHAFLAGMQRDYLMRTRSRIRTDAHAAMREQSLALEKKGPCDVLAAGLRQLVAIANGEES